MNYPIGVQSFENVRLDGSAEEALRQIGEKAYARAFADDARTLFEIGVNFDGDTRTIKEWKKNIQQKQN